MIYLGSNEILGIKLGNTDISAIYAGDLLIYPTTVTAWSVSPAEIEMEASGGTANISIASLSSWTISSSENWVTFSQASGDSGRTRVIATIDSHQTESARAATITVTDGTNTSTISVSQEAYVANPYYNEYLTFRITGAGNIKWYSQSANSLKTISYSKDNGSTWTSVTASTSNSGTTISVSVGDVIIFKGTNTNYSNGTAQANSGFRNSTAKFTLEGNIMSLIYGDNFVGNDEFPTNSGSYHFCRMFQSCTGITDASNLVLPCSVLYTGDYRSMFDTASSMSGAPELPATTLADECYFNMFLRCSSMTTAPELPALTVPSAAYQAMFYGCATLNYIRCLATDISASNATTQWVQYVQTSTGTFAKNPNMSSWGRGVNGIPNNWTITDYSV